MKKRIKLKFKKKNNIKYKINSSLLKKSLLFNRKIAITFNKVNIYKIMRIIIFQIITKIKKDQTLLFIVKKQGKEAKVMYNKIIMI